MRVIPYALCAAAIYAVAGHPVPALHALGIAAVVAVWLAAYRGLRGAGEHIPDVNEVQP